MTTQVASCQHGNSQCKMDLHQCGDCQKQFDSYEDFLIHKLLYEEYNLTTEPSKRIPGLWMFKFTKAQPLVSTVESVKQLKQNGANQANLREMSMSKETCIKNTNPSDISDKSTNNAFSVSEIVPVRSNGLEDMTVEVEVESVAQTAEDMSESLVLVGVSSEDGDLESDDNVSVLSQTEGLRIDESAPVKDCLSSPRPDTKQETDSKSELMCNYCDRSYKNKVVLQVHKETVHGCSRSFPCTKCNQNFKTKGNLVRHMRIHTGERPFHCSKCGLSFHDSGTLCRHIKRIHHKSPGHMVSKEVKIIVTEMSSEKG